MSNRAYLSRTRFEGDHDGVSWGWRLSDDEFRSYTDACKEEEVPTDPLELLAKAAAESSPQESEFFDVLLVAGCGIFINGAWYGFEQIEPVLRKALVGEE